MYYYTDFGADKRFPATTSWIYGLFEFQLQVNARNFSDWDDSINGMLRQRGSINHPLMRVAKNGQHRCSFEIGVVTDEPISRLAFIGPGKFIAVPDFGWTGKYECGLTESDRRNACSRLGRKRPSRKERFSRCLYQPLTVRQIHAVSKDDPDTLKTGRKIKDAVSGSLRFA